MKSSFAQFLLAALLLEGIFCILPTMGNSQSASQTVQGSSPPCKSDDWVCIGAHSGSSISSPTGSAASQLYGGFAWRDTGMQADWPGHDYSCTQGASPNSQLCNRETRGRVAVCWLRRQTGECGGASEWCTYKALTLDVPPTGTSPGRVYVCSEQSSK
jgi:hypothetical protein